MNATKERFGADDLEELLDGATRILVAKGKKMLAFDMTKDPPSAEVLAKAVLGPSGNLRAPTLRSGKQWVVGFNDEAYESHFD